MTDARAFRGFRFPAEVILWAVRWYLRFPVSYRDLELMLADRGVQVDHVNRLGWTALLEAVILSDGGPRHQDVVRALLEVGADRSIGDNDGVTALEHARARGYTEIAALLEA